VWPDGSAWRHGWQRAERARRPRRRKQQRDLEQLERIIGGLGVVPAFNRVEEDACVVVRRQNFASQPFNSVVGYVAIWSV
jgi:hypothetical protein